MHTNCRIGAGSGIGAEVREEMSQPDAVRDGTSSLPMLGEPGAPAALRLRRTSSFELLDLPPLCLEKVTPGWS